MFTGSNERIIYRHVPLRVDGYNGKNIISLGAEGSVGDFRYLALIDEHFIVARHDFNITKATSLRINLPDTSFFGLSFNLKNDITCNIAGVGTGVCFKDQFNLSYFPSINIEYEFDAGDYTIISIEISKEYLVRFAKPTELLSGFLDKIEQGGPAFFSPRPLYGSSQITRVIDMLMLAREKEAWLLATAKTIELLWLCLERMNTTAFGKPIPLTHAQEDAIRKAYKYLLGHLHENPSYDLLAHKYGLSKYKLTKGFKYLYGIELAKFIQHAKLEHAHHLIEVEGQTVEKAAEATGYGSPQNLQPPFKKYFGYNPSEILKFNKNSAKRRS